MTQAFLPLLTGSRGAIVNNVSMMALAPLPFTPAYAISKAAAFNLTQSLRALLAGRGIRVHAVLTGPTDTDMTCGFDIPKASPESVARAIFDGVQNEEEDIFPDPLSASLAESWRGGAVKAMERDNASFAAAEPAAEAAEPAAEPARPPRPRPAAAEGRDNSAARSWVSLLVEESSVSRSTSEITARSASVPNGWPEY